MTPVLVAALVAAWFVAMPWLSARSELLRAAIRFQLRWHVSWPYVLRMLFIEPVLGLPIALVALAIATSRQDSGPPIVAASIAAVVALAVANLRPPRLVPVWLRLEFEDGTTPLPRRGIYDWAFFAFFELAALGAIVLVLLGANR